MTAIIAFFLGPIGKWVGIGLIAAIAVGGWGEKRYWDGRAAYKAKIERQINEAIATGNQGRADALRQLDAEQLPGTWFRD